jgi:hypothetical protein
VADRTPITAGRIIGTATGGTGNRKSPERAPGFLLAAKNLREKLEAKSAGGLRPERRAFNSRPDIFMPGVLQRGHEIFLALAFEFFLRGFEAGNARDDFFPLQSGVVWLFGHAHPF